VSGETGKPERTVPTRGEIETKFTWNTPSVFASDGAWEKAVSGLAERLGELQASQGKLGDSPEVLADPLDLFNELMRLPGRVMVCATMSHSVDITDQAATKVSGRARSLFGQLAAAMAFFDPAFGSHWPMPAMAARFR
jgi:oligoendopeptidase F